MHFSFFQNEKPNKKSDQPCVTAQDIVTSITINYAADLISFKQATSTHVLLRNKPVRKQKNKIKYLLAHLKSPSFTDI